jgi:hypothetical protein
MHPGLSPSRFHLSGQKPHACIRTDAVQKEEQRREWAPQQVLVFLFFLFFLFFLISNIMADRLTKKCHAKKWPCNSRLSLWSYRISSHMVLVIPDMVHGLSRFCNLTLFMTGHDEEVEF